MKRFAGLSSLFAICLSVVAAAPQTTNGSLQTVTDRAMSGLQGSVVVLDVKSGRLVAGHRVESAARRLVRPGSTIKPFTVLALMDAGLLTPSTTRLCARTVRVAGHTLDCAHVAIPEPVDSALALAYSCNSFFVQMAEHLQPDLLLRTLREAGFTTPTGLAASEVSGVLQMPSTRESLQLLAVGEEGLQTTPLEMASAYRKLASRVRRGDKQLAPILEGLKGAAQYGTAQRAASPGPVIAGKTGTAASSDRARPHAWFAGFSPADAPEIVVVVFLEQGSGGADAAPVAQRIFEAYR